MTDFSPSRLHRSALQTRGDHRLEGVLVPVQSVMRHGRQSRLPVLVDALFPRQMERPFLLDIGNDHPGHKEGT